MSAVQTIELGDDAQDQRLDRWFRKRFPQIGQGRIEKMCRKGEIRVDGGRVKASTRLNRGQMLRVPPLPDAAPAAKPVRRVVSDDDARMLKDAVIYQDDDLIALNKPAGISVQGGTKQQRHIDGMMEVFRSDDGEKPKLVHRLDRDTSGVLVLARNGYSGARLAKAFQSRRTRKIYWAAVASVPSPRAGTISYGLVKAAGHGPNGAGEKMMCIHPSKVHETPNAKRAVSDYMTLAQAAKRAAWVALSPITGRTHQLRAHMAEIGCPIVGDGKYGTNSQTNEGDGWGAQLGGEISRKLHLHARYLILEHPRTGHTLTLSAKLPEHMTRTWDFFAWSDEDIPTDPFNEEDPW